VTLTRYDQPKVHETSHDDLIVFEAVDHICEGDASLESRVSLVVSKPGFDVLSLRLCHPLGVLGEIRDGKVPKERDEAGQAAFQDEDPSPTEVPFHAVHFADGRRKETAESTSQRCAGKEESVPFLCLVSLVPHADKIEGA
jgi:hypothetical protein